MTHRFLRQFLQVAALVTLAPGWFHAAPAVTINGAGATFPQPIYAKWFQAYHDAHPDVDFNYQAVGSGAGIAQYKAGTVDFGATDAPLDNTDLAAMPQPTLHIPTVAGAIVLSYHINGVGPGLRLSGGVIADIYLGRITKWNDPRIQQQNPAVRLSDEPITVVHRSDGSGTTNIYTNYLASVSPTWRTKVGIGKSVNWPVGLGGKGNPGVAGLVLQTDGAIGYVELAYALQEHLPYGPVKNRAGNYVLASIASTSASIAASSRTLSQDSRIPFVNARGVNSYPIAGFTFLLVPTTWKDAAKAHAFVDFLRWAMGPGQEMAETLRYAPLPRALASANVRALSRIQMASR